MLFRLLLVGEGPFGDVLKTRFAAADLVVDEVEVDRFWREPEARPFDLAVVARQNLPGDVGTAVARLRALEQKPELVVCGVDLPDRDVLALQAAGCFAVVPLGLADEALENVFGKLITRRRETVARVTRALHGSSVQVDDLVCESAATRQILKIAGRVAVSDTSLLVLGETGVGKEWLARAVHGQSPRASGPFIPVNCGAIPENLLESELFGHEKGAFTGAVRARRGYFEQAHGGTLFLDEIGEMPPHLQVRLLRVLQDRTIQRLGGEESIPVDSRVVAATHKDLKAAIESGEFRRDLYYRLAVVTLTVPPLRERTEDIPALAEKYLRDFRIKLARPDIDGLSQQALDALLAYGWPGNVRELINVVERAVLLADGPNIELVDLPIEMAAPVETTSIGRNQTRPMDDLESWLDQPLEAGRLAVVADFERRYFERLLERNRGQVGKTAEQAGIDPRTLYNKMQRLGLYKRDFKDKTMTKS